MYKHLGSIALLVLFGMTTSVQSALTKRDQFSLPKLRCFLTETQFFTEIKFRKPDNRFAKNGFVGDLSSYILVPNQARKLFSSVPFKNVTVIDRNSIMGATGDEFSTTGGFTLKNLNARTGVSGDWQYVHTDLGGGNKSTILKCVYVSNPRQDQ